MPKGIKGFVSRPLADRFWEKVDKRGPDECWPWRGWSDQSGRGQIRTPDGRQQKAPRVAWELTYGEPIPAHLQACHACDNPTCVNPAHLWTGTMKENMLDARRKGRLRSPQELGVIPHNKLKTHCKRGHPFNDENTRYHSKGRQCRICQRMHGRASDARIKARRAGEHV